MGAGTIHSSNVGDVCPGCGQSTRSQDWTCPRCGHILDRYLFGTITAKSVTGADKDAFQAGYAACMSKWKSSGSTELSEYRPVPGHETAYRAGWQNAAAKLEGKAERKRGRRRGLVLLGIGTLLSAVGVPLVMDGFSRGSGARLPYIILGAGILNILFGIVAVITGDSDE
jgi:hypothetical protein